MPGLAGSGEFRDHKRSSSQVPDAQDNIKWQINGSSGNKSYVTDIALNAFGTMRNSSLESNLNSQMPAGQSVSPSPNPWVAQVGQLRIGGARFYDPSWSVAGETYANDYRSNPFLSMLWVPDSIENRVDYQKARWMPDAVGAPSFTKNTSRAIDHKVVKKDGIFQFYNELRKHAHNNVHAFHRGANEYRSPVRLF